ncbi:dipeptide epimerase [Ktedonobacteria bacterium brp13]|nr:dipeptide epimerase [Ktedonobacteria bacterium brp13]
MQLVARPIELHLTDPFRISRSVQHSASNIVVAVTHQGLTGLGEAAPSSYYGESTETVLATLPRLASELGDDPFQIEEIMARLQQVIRLNPAAKAAIDMALYDLQGKLLNVPLYTLLGISAQRTPQTSFTIGLASPAEMARKAQAAQAYPIFKVKVGTRNDLENIKAIRDVSNAIIRVDANGGWTPKEAIQTINALAPYGIEFVEQPVVAHDLAGLKLVRDNVAVPVFADESCVALEDIPRLSECVDGIVLKLMKSNGINTLLKMIHTARACHLRIMLGCMIESSLAITAAAHLTPLVDYADLDGNLLVSDDPYRGVTVDAGRLVLPSAPGLGVQPVDVMH